MQLFARFESASGKMIDEPERKDPATGRTIPGTARKEALINELNLCGYSEHEARLAEKWILYGDPVRFGSITLADFFPWKNLKKEQLEAIGFDVMGEIKKAERAAENKGYEMGYSDARNQIQPKEKNDKPILIPLTDAERIDYERLKGKVEGLEESLANLHEQNRKREKYERNKQTRRTP